MSDHLDRELLKRFGYAEFRAGQRELVEALLAGRDALGVMPTGGGKSLCFQLPATLLEGTALVISPLIALMKDQVDALKARGIHAEAYNSTLTLAERRRAEDAIRGGRVRLLYMAPERMQQEGFMELLANTPLSLLAIDEAHCISHWGHDFRPDYRRLGELRRFLRGVDSETGLKPVPVIALTATATQRVQADIVERLGMRKPAQVITGFRRTNLAFEVKRCSGRAEKLKQLRALAREAVENGGSAVIYAATRKNVEWIAEELSDLKVGYYHAGLTDLQREKAQDEFLSDPHKILVATNAFGMGIDKPNVRVVAHFDIPGSVEAYYQEAGRAGRDGLPARCVLLFNHADVATQDFFIQQTARELTGDEASAVFQEHIQNQQALLKQLVRYAYATTCRQKLVLSYFGDPETRNFTENGGCGNCDCCRPERKDLVAVDEFVSIAARQALTALGRMNGRFGKTRLCEVLKGSDVAQVRQLGLQNHPSYGVLRDWSGQRIREFVDRLIDDGYIQVSGLEYPVLWLTPQGQKALRGEVPVFFSEAWEAHSPRSSSRHSGGRSQAEGEAGLPPADEALLGVLKKFRREEAERQKVPAYVVFHDKTLREIAARKPRALEALARIPGLGPKKLETYGEKLVSLVVESE